MHKTIAAFSYKNGEVPGEFHKVIKLGVSVIEKEFNTSIHYEININTGDKLAELRLIDATLQNWFQDASCREIITFKLSTHFKICLEQFAMAV